MATARARAQGAAVLRALRHAGVRARIFGSVARHRARPDSDIDVLILDRGEVEFIEVVRLAETAQGEFPLDIVFSEQLWPAALELMLEESRAPRRSQDTETMDGNLQTLFDYSMGKIWRHEARRLLGVDDGALTTLLRQAGWPPPRASQEEERMLDEIKNIHLRRPRSLVEVALWGRELGEPDACLREFMDEFYVERDPDKRAAMLADEPPLSSNEHYNAYFAAVAEHLALRFHLPVPAWTDAPARFLANEWFPAGLKSLEPILRMESPPAFRRRMIFVGADPLYRPRRDATGIGEAP